MDLSLEYVVEAYFADPLSRFWPSESRLAFMTEIAFDPSHYRGLARNKNLLILFGRSINLKKQNYNEQCKLYDKSRTHTASDTVF